MRTGEASWASLWNGRDERQKREVVMQLSRLSYRMAAQIRERMLGHRSLSLAGFAALWSRCDVVAVVNVARVASADHSAVATMATNLTTLIGLLLQASCRDERYVAPAFF